eukprot:GGOE01054515.1.p1 GENE.GGOE01054515.1~~GGOE01054515.1.p1  ORF type:complete len:489 (-),score=95.66 GGOE01054515.1:46-1512(-)
MDGVAVEEAASPVDTDLSSLWDSDLEGLFFPTFTTRQTLLRAVASLPCPVSHHASALTDDCLFVFAGRNRPQWSHSCRPLRPTMFMFHLPTGQWQEVFSPLTPSARWGHSLVTMVDHTRKRLVLYGGCSDGDMCGDLWEFNCEEFTWRRGRYLNAEDATPAPRAHHSAVVSDALMVVFGGVGAGGTCLGGVHLYHLEAQTWLQPTTAPASAPSGRFGHSAVVHGLHMFVFGGEVQRARPAPRGRPPCMELVRCNDLFMYNIETATWTELVHHNCDLVPTPRSCHSATLYGDVMVVVGGTDHDRAICNDMYAFNLETQDWTKFTFPLKGKTVLDPLQRHSHTACLGHDGQLLLVGGCHFQDHGRQDVVAVTLRPLSLKELVAKFIVEAEFPYREEPDAALAPWSDIPESSLFASSRPGTSHLPRKRRCSNASTPRAKAMRACSEDWDSVGPSSPSSCSSEDSAMEAQSPPSGENKLMVDLLVGNVDCIS